MLMEHMKNFQEYLDRYRDNIVKPSITAPRWPEPVQTSPNSCPCCGRCPSCGRGGYVARPYYYEEWKFQTPEQNMGINPNPNFQ